MNRCDFQRNPHSSTSTRNPSTPLRCAQDASFRSRPVREAGARWAKCSPLFSGALAQHIDKHRAEITNPIATVCHSVGTFNNTRPFRKTAMVSTPIAVPAIVPDPPEKLAPPMITAAMASNS